MKNKTKKSLLLLAFGLVVSSGLAQESVIAAGGDASGNLGTSSYTVGQVIYTTNTGTGGSLAPGLQQAFQISIPLGAEITEIKLELIAYPNPTSNNLNLSIANFNNEKLTYQLYSISGTLLESKPILDGSTIIGMQGLAGNTYLVNVLQKNVLLKTFKIIKK